jgi:hypothetical protein
MGLGTIDPVVVHPTAATPMLFNCYTAPFLFLVTELPYEFRKWLVTIGVHEVDSHLGLLFVENGVPIPHDYVVTLTNYNMKTDSEVLRERAHESVRRSVVNLLFETPSDTSKRIADFIKKFCDNIDNVHSNEEARRFIQNSVKVSSLDVTVPGTKITTTVYNVYAHPPSANPDICDRWRKWIANQKYHTRINGVGVKYQFTWKCLHCKTINHPTGLCPLVKNLKKQKGVKIEDPTEAEDLLPLEPTPGPSHHSHRQTRAKCKEARAKIDPISSPVQNRRTDNKPKANVVRAAVSKKRKVN